MTDPDALPGAGFTFQEVSRVGDHTCGVAGEGSADCGALRSVNLRGPPELEFGLAEPSADGMDQTPAARPAEPEPIPPYEMDQTRT